MTPPPPAPERGARFRLRLQLALMLSVAGVTVLLVTVTQRNAVSEARRGFEREFRAQIAAGQHAREQRLASLLELCRGLVRRSRIHAALEDDALDLLYPSARDELWELTGPGGAGGQRAEFYRFLDRRGAVIRPEPGGAAGALSAEEERAVSLPSLPASQQLGYLGGADGVREIITTPIVSTETGEIIAALVLGFSGPGPTAAGRGAGLADGIWLQGRLYLAGLAAEPRLALAQKLAESAGPGGPEEGSFQADVAGGPSLVFYRELNPRSLYPPAFQASVYPLSELQARRRVLLWQVLGGAAVVLALALGVSRIVARRLALPVEELAHESEREHAERERAEAALQLKQQELQRAARFSADASHQLKTPVAVLRLGLEDLLSRPGVGEDHAEEISALVHQTYRLSGVVDDLLLLSMMDAGRLQIERTPVDLHRLIEGWLDDLGALPDPFSLGVESAVPVGICVAGTPRYTGLILQNLLENARKYNRPGGRIRVEAREEGSEIVVVIGNTGRPIPPEAQEHVFDRFHRGSVGENVPGHGLGLNLARELARVHGGELSLERSADDWTEFVLRLPKAGNPHPEAGA